MIHMHRVMSLLAWLVVGHALMSTADAAAATCLKNSRGIRVPLSPSRSRRIARETTAGNTSASKYSVEFIKNYLAGEYERKATAVCSNAVRAEWDFVTDLLNKTKENIYNEASLNLARFEKDEWGKYFKDVNVDDFNDDEVTRRQVEYLMSLGVSALNETALKELNGYEVRMQNTYSIAKICPYKKQSCSITHEGYALDPEIEGVMAKSRSYEELLYTWKAWHDASGKNMRQDYKGYIRLQNAAAEQNGFEDMGQMWQSSFESEYFYDDMLDLWSQVLPLYQELHTFVYQRLRQYYGPDKMGDDDGLIPAHLLGNMWAQSWINIYDLVQPYPNGTAYDVTKSLREQGYTPYKMFVKSDEFYKSLGLKPNDMSYGPRAVIEKPSNRELICHGSAWDFCDGKDFRIKMCTKVNSEDFRTIHHEMGHIQYFIQYKDQPYVFRSGANPGFHEAIGDTIALSVDNPKHLKAIGLLKHYDDNLENSVNALMKMALEKVAFLPFGLLVDLWRWDVFSGNITESEWNQHWWRLREELQGMKSPLNRTEDDFDPGAKFHIPSSYQYISYFVAHILQFQLYRALCIEAGEYNPEDPSIMPLHKCDFYKSVKAGEKFSEGLAMGASVHWSEVLYAITGERDLNASALLEYFKPLQDFLEEANGQAAQTAAASSSEQITAFLFTVLLFIMVHVYNHQY